jgi:hypothetical protein
MTDHHTRSLDFTDHLYTHRLQRTPCNVRATEYIGTGRLRRP